MLPGKKLKSRVLEMQLPAFLVKDFAKFRISEDDEKQ